MNNRSVWALCSAIIVLQAALLGYGLTRASPTDHLQTPISPPSDLAMPLEIETVLPFAQSVAKTWRSEAKLVRANLQIDWPHEPTAARKSDLPAGGWIMLAFVGGDKMLTMRLDRGSGIIVEGRISTLDAKTQSSYGASPLDLASASTTSGTAMQAVEAAYGNSFRTACPDQRFTSWIFSAVDPATGARSWHAEYEQRSDSPQPSMSVDIAWATGDLSNVKNATQPCA